ncbi:hypothetical protein Tco_0907119 [Tanacetum coccineum]|uniref:Uncharacterized protein n=1 Tax=Tanacetum coccineum TaxID=301880 RepID=A0ABQ5CPK4_9ASTR
MDSEKERETYEGREATKTLNEKKATILKKSHQKAKDKDGTMIPMLAERRYPLSRELMIRMLEHGMEVEDESETAITLIHLFILWTTANGDNP